MDGVAPWKRATISCPSVCASEAAVSCRGVEVLRARGVLCAAGAGPVVAVVGAARRAAAAGGRRALPHATSTPPAKPARSMATSTEAVRRAAGPLSTGSASGSIR